VRDGLEDGGSREAPVKALMKDQRFGILQPNMSGAVRRDDAHRNDQGGRGIGRVAESRAGCMGSLTNKSRHVFASSRMRTAPTRGNWMGCAGLLKAHTSRGRTDRRSLACLSLEVYR